jgi:hypothetical protein
MDVSTTPAEAGGADAGSGDASNPMEHDATNPDTGLEGSGLGSDTGSPAPGADSGATTDAAGGDAEPSGGDEGTDASIDATLDAGDEGGSDASDATTPIEDGSAADVTGSSDSPPDAAVEDSSLDDVSEAGPGPGEQGGPCALDQASTPPCFGAPTTTCSVNENLCLLNSGAQCTDSSQCANGMSCVTGTCGDVCANVVTNSTGTCNLPGGPSGVGTGTALLATCAVGYVCRESLAGQWDAIVPLCGIGGARSLCIPQDIPMEGFCDLPPETFTTHACMPGLTCSFDQDASAPAGSGVCE